MGDWSSMHPPLSLSPPIVAPEHLHSSAVCAVHLQVGHHSTAGRPELRCLASSFNLFSQSEQFVDALLRLERARRLTLPDVPAEITHRHGLSALRRPGSIPEAFLFHDASFSSAALLVRLLDDRKSIIRLHIAVAAGKRHAEARHASVDPGLIAHAESLPQPVADATRPQLELLR